MPFGVELLRLYRLPIPKHPAMLSHSIISYNQSSMPFPSPLPLSPPLPRRPLPLFLDLPPPPLPSLTPSPSSPLSLHPSYHPPSPFPPPPPALTTPQTANPNPRIQSRYRSTMPTHSPLSGSAPEENSIHSSRAAFSSLQTQHGCGGGGVSVGGVWEGCGDKR